MSRMTIAALIIALALTVSLFLFLTSKDTSQFLVFSTWGTPEEVESFRRLVDYYNLTHHPAHPVKLSHADHASYTELLLVQAAARSLPDVIHFDTKDLPFFVRRGLLEELTPYLERDTSFHLDRFLPQLLPGGVVEGGRYAIPHNFSTFVLYFNRDHFDAEGLAYPDSTWTWDTLRIAAQRLTKRDAAGKPVRYGCLTHIVLYTMIYQNGGRILNQALDSCVIASPEAAQAFQFDTDLSEKYGVTWNILAQNIQWDDMFAGGRCSMIANGRWAAAWYVRSMPPGAMDVAPLPHGKFRRGAMVNHLMSISSESSKKEEAWEFLKFLVSDVGQRMVNEAGANIPALRSIVTSDAFLHHPRTPQMHNEVFLSELPYAVEWPFPQGPYLTEHILQSETDLAQRRILLGEATVMQSLQTMEDNVNRVIAAERGVPAAKPLVGSVLFYFLCTLPFVAVAAVRASRRRRHAHGS
jgi:multiple sugar transport system substrate-binding protein